MAIPFYCPEPENPKPKAKESPPVEVEMYTYQELLEIFEKAIERFREREQARLNTRVPARARSASPVLERSSIERIYVHRGPVRAQSAIHIRGRSRRIHFNTNNTEYESDERVTENRPQPSQNKAFKRMRKFAINTWKFLKAMVNKF